MRANKPQFNFQTFREAHGIRYHETVKELVVCKLGLVNKQDISYRFSNILKY
mgnify:FL=1